MSTQDQTAQPAGQTSDQGQAASAPDAVQIPETYLRGNEKIFEGVKSQDDLFKGYVNAQRMIGRGIFLPDEKATPEERQAVLQKVWAKLGWPETPDKYEIRDLPKLPAGVAWNEGLLTEAKKAAHAAGLTNEQFAKLLQVYPKLIEPFVPQVADRQQVEQLLVERWGEAVYQRRVAEAQTAARVIGGEAFMKWLDESGAGNSPELIEFLSKVGREMAEAGVIDEGLVEGVLTNADYEKKALDIIANKDNPDYKAYRDNRDPRHKEVVEKVANLFKLASV